MRICITGIIGSGKSSVSCILAQAGEICVSADEINSRLLTNPTYISSLKDIFPSVIVDGRVDKVKLSNIVFNYDEALAKLEKLAHPLIMSEMLEKTNGEGIYFCEVPTLNAEYIHEFDEIWYISCDDELLVDRIRARDGIDAIEVAKRLEAHNKYRSIKLHADIIIHNDGDFQHLRKLVYGELQSLKLRAKLI